MNSFILIIIFSFSFSTKGTLPIEDVQVSWALLSETYENLDCEGCSGEVLSDEGGVFTISIKANHEALAGRNPQDFPIKLFFSKTSPGSPDPISHEFLCNDGIDGCDKENGHIVYLRHLHFEKPLHIYDDTSVPFSGKISIADTPFSGSPEGCALPGAKVCVMHKTITGTFQEIVCGNTDIGGLYMLPVVAGSTIHQVDVTYRVHEFRQTSDIDYAAGILILPENAPFFNNDFVDITKANLRVEVVGGQCNKPLGKSKVLIKVTNCDWEPELFAQSGTLREYNNLPAHLIHVEVRDIFDQDDKQIFPVWQFFQGESPIIRVVDLRDANKIKEDFEAEEKSVETNTSTGTEDTDTLQQEEENLAAIEEKEKEGLDTVRFQYNGVLRMEVLIEKRKDNLNCDDADPADYGDANSLHVIDYMTAFRVDVMLEYEILTGVFCDIVDDDLKILVNNQVGKDSFAGNEEFEAMIDNKNTTNFLNRCSPLADGACLFNVTHNTNEEGENIGKAGLKNLMLATGRPNIVSPYTKNIIFKIIGGTSEVEYKAAIFVSGLYSKGPGNSFALPTHEPIMVLRDPPGKLPLPCAKLVSSYIFTNLLTPNHNHFISRRHVLCKLRKCSHDL